MLLFYLLDKTHNDIQKDMPKPLENALPELKSPSSRSNPESRKYNLRSSQKKPIEVRT